MAVKKSTTQTKSAPKATSKSTSQSGASKTVVKVASKPAVVNKAVSSAVKPKMATQTAAKPATTTQSVIKQAVSSIFGGKVTETQKFGNKNNIYKSGVHGGEDYAGKAGTPEYVPPGNWQAEKVVSNVNRPGFLGNYSDNQGWGNQVILRNKDTGEKIAFNHLQKANLQQGTDVPSGSILGTMGTTGNSTGVHTDLRYTNAQGQNQPFSSSPYGKYIDQGFGINPIISDTMAAAKAPSTTAFLPNMPQVDFNAPVSQPTVQASQPTIKAYQPNDAAFSQGLSMIPQTNAYQQNTPSTDKSQEDKKFWWQV